MRTVLEDPAHPDNRKQFIEADGVCFQKARARGEMTFTLVEQDLSAPHTILYWIDRNLETAPIEKLRDAFEKALAMRFSDTKKKLAD